MTALVDDLLDVSRVTRGLVQLNRETVDIRAVVGSAIEQTRPLIETRRHHLSVRMAAEPGSVPIQVQGDRTRLVQVLANLLGNAAKYTPLDGRLILAVHADTAHVELSVIDNGNGIDSVLLPHVFELFTQAGRTPDRSQGGLGIGLALVKNMVALHGGTVTASSAGPGQGTTFTIVLPAVSAAPAQASHPHAVLPAASAAPLHVMVVDDNIDAAETSSSLLEMQGHAVTVRTHPIDAIVATRQLASAGTAPQAVILDIGLPEMDGYELARQLRADMNGTPATFIALTGYGQADDRVLSHAAGFDHHFVKPMDTEVLTQVLAAVPR